MPRLQLTTRFDPKNFDLSGKKPAASTAAPSSPPAPATPAAPPKENKENTPPSSSSVHFLHAEEVVLLDITSLVVHSNIRENIDEASIDDLAASIKEVGILNPIWVFPEKSKYFIIVGQRRYLACKKCGFAKMPCIIRDKPSELDLIYFQAIENEQTSSLTPEDQEKYIRRLTTEFNQPIDVIAQKMGKSKRWVQKMLNASETREKLGNKFTDKGITLTTSDAQNLANVDDELVQEALEKITENPTQKTTILEETRKKSATKRGTAKPPKKEKPLSSTSFGELEHFESPSDPDTEEADAPSFEENYETVSDPLSNNGPSADIEPFVSPLSENSDDYKYMKNVNSIFVNYESRKFKLRVDNSGEDRDLVLTKGIENYIIEYFKSKQYTQDFTV